MAEKPDGVHPRMEKYILRKAFDTQPPYLPASVLWRQKEQFSDGVGYDWVDGLKAYAQKACHSEHLSLSFPHPRTFVIVVHLSSASVAAVALASSS